MAGMLVRGSRKGAQFQIDHLTPVPHKAARGLVADVYAQIERDFGMLAPPVSLHAAAPEVLAGCWMMLRETLLTEGRTDRVTREMVATAVSAGNACPYCVEVHTTTMYGLVGARDAAAISGDRITSIADRGLRAIALWARASGRRDAAARYAVPFPAEDTAEMIGVAVTFQYLNRLVNVFLAASPFPPWMPSRARSGLGKVLGRIMRRKGATPGASLGLLPETPLPADLSWAAGDPAIAGAFARAAAAMEAAGARSVPEPVRELVLAELGRWDGCPPGISRAWADDALAGLPEALRPAGRLALLTAMASYQVDKTVIDEFRLSGADDRALVELVAWASMAAARRAGGWVRLPVRPVAVENPPVA